MTIQLRIATPQDAPLIHDTYGHYVLASTATFNEINPTWSLTQKISAASWKPIPT